MKTLNNLFILDFKGNKNDWNSTNKSLEEKTGNQKVKALSFEMVDIVDIQGVIVGKNA